MELLTFLLIIVLVTNGVYCYVPHSDYGAASAPSSKTQSFSAQQQSAQANDISVYDPGAGKLNNVVIC